MSSPFYEIGVEEQRRAYHLLTHEVDHHIEAHEHYWTVTLIYKVTPSDFGTTAVLDTGNLRSDGGARCLLCGLLMTEETTRTSCAGLMP